MALSQIKGSTGIADATITSAKLADFTAAVDLNGVELLLDADADTSISADTDDQIDIKIANADHLKILSSSGDTVLKPMVDAKDIIFQQFDGNKVFEINDGNFVSVGGNATAAGQIRIYEDTDNGSHYSGFTVGNLTASVAYQLPDADGSSGQGLTTDGSGVLSWSTLSANTPTSADGQALGSASLEWSDLFLADGGTIQFGNDQDVTLTHVADTGLLLSATDQLQFGDSGTYIHQSADGVLDLVSDTEIEINATTIDVNGNLDVSGTIVSAGTITGTLATAAQGNITSLGTLTALTVDDVAVDGKVITMTGSTDDTAVFTVAANGALTLETTDTAAAAANIQITADGTFEVDATTITLDSAGDVALDAGGGNIKFVNAGTEFARISPSSSDVIIEAKVQDKDLLFKGDDGGSVITALTLDMSAAGKATFNDQVVIGDGKLVLNSTAVTSTAAELNLLDGVSGLVQADLTKLAAVDSTAAELNIVDGGTSATSTTIADADRVVVNDNGTMVQVAVTDLSAYFDDEITAMPNLVTVGAANTTTTLAGIPFYQGDTGSIYTHNVSGTDDSAQYNTAYGVNALAAITTADNNVAIGYEAGSSLTTHNSDVLIGYQAGKALSTDDDGVIAIGYQAGLSLTTCSSSVFIGKNAGDGHDTEDHNMGIGRNALTGSVAGGEYNVGIGNYSLAALTSADNNVAIGYLAGTAITSGGTNTLIGYEAGTNITTETGNTFIGEQSGRANTGSSNTGGGRDTLYTNTNGQYNVAIGDGALTTLNDTGGTDEADKNTSVGYQAGANATTGAFNTHVGYQAGIRATTTNANCLIGRGTGGPQTGNGANNLIGTSCGNSMTSAYYNQALGSSCLTSVTDGYNNIAIGHDAGLVVTTGNHNIYMGYKTIASSNSETNTILIGMGDGINNFSSGGSDNIRIGKRTSYIHTDNDSASFSTGSDERWKKNIADNSVGLDFINELRTVTYNWKKHSELDNTFSEYDSTDVDSPDDTKLKYGLIAQEVKTAMDTHSVNEKFEGWRADSSHPDGKQMVSNDAFVIPLIKAVQELTTRIKALEDA